MQYANYEGHPLGLSLWRKTFVWILPRERCSELLVKESVTKLHLYYCLKGPQAQLTRLLKPTALGFSRKSCKCGEKRPLEGVLHMLLYLPPSWKRSLGHCRQMAATSHRKRLLPPPVPSGKCERGLPPTPCPRSLPDLTLPGEHWGKTNILRDAPGFSVPRPTQLTSGHGLALEEALTPMDGAVWITNPSQDSFGGSGQLVYTQQLIRWQGHPAFWCLCATLGKELSWATH